MAKTKKLIELDNDTIQVLEKQAKITKRSLKNYIEFTLSETALRYTEPSEEYKAMMDDMIARDENGTLKTTPISEVLKQYGRKL